MLRQSWAGLGMLTFLELPHTSRMLRNCVILVHTNMLDATHLVQINMAVSFLSNMLDTTPVMGTFLELAHILDATQLCYSCAHKHA